MSLSPSTSLIPLPAGWSRLAAVTTSDCLPHTTPLRFIHTQHLYIGTYLRQSPRFLHKGCQDCPQATLNLNCNYSPFKVNITRCLISVLMSSGVQMSDVFPVILPPVPCVFLVCFSVRFLRARIVLTCATCSIQRISYLTE